MRTGSPMLNAGASRPAVIRFPACRRLHPSGADWGLPKASEGRWAQCEGLEAPAHRAWLTILLIPTDARPRLDPPGRSGVDLVAVDPREGWRCGLAMPRPGRNRGAIGEGRRAGWLHVRGAALMVQDRSLSSCQTLRPSQPTGCAGIATLTGVSGFRYPSRRSFA